MNMKDVAPQIASYYFVCVWLIAWGTIVLLGVISSVIEKLRGNKKNNTSKER